MTLANMLNVASGSENPLLRLVSNARKDGSKVRIVSNYDIDAVIASGIVVKYLLQSDVRYEYLTTLDLDRAVLAKEVPTISFGTHLSELRNCVSLVRGERSEIRRLGDSYLVSTPYYSYNVLKVLEDVMIVTNDVRYYVLTSMLGKYIPRLKAYQVDDLVRNYVKELCDLNLLRVVRGLKIFNYSLVEVSKALSRSLDVFVPGYGGADLGRDVRSLSEAELGNEVLSSIAKFSQTKFLVNDLVGDNYYTAQEWFFRDMYEFLYALISVADVYGVHYIVASISVTNYLPLIRLKYEGLLKELAANISKVKDVGIQQVRKNLYRVRLSSQVPITPICKVLKSYFIPLDSIVVYELDNYLYISLFDTPLDSAASLVRGGYERVGSLIRFKELRLS